VDGASGPAILGGLRLREMASRCSGARAPSVEAPAHALEFIHQGRTGLAQRIFDTLQAAASVQTLQDLTDVFRPTLADIGFTHFCVTDVSGLTAGVALTPVFGQLDPAWYDVYTREGLAHIDPRLHHVLGSTEPAFLSELCAARDLPSDRQFLASLRAHGHADSFVWPAHLPGGRLRAVLMLSGRSEAPAEARIAAGVLAPSFYTAGARLLRQLRATNGPSIDLRPRQVECLHWARQGKSSADIGAILGISARTVDEHVAHACDALGVRTRIQAVTRAVLLGLL
jgi:DNA-binding CsgD family transcriptional regulator